MKNHRDKRGVALIMVLVLTAILSTLAADLSSKSQVNMHAAANARDQYQAYLNAKSAVEFELFVLRFQNLIPEMVASSLPIPLYQLSGSLISSDALKGTFSQSESEEEKTEESKSTFDHPFGDFRGKFFIESIEDENQKINLNRDIGQGTQNQLPTLIASVIANPSFDPLFEKIGDGNGPARTRLAIVRDIIDWVDDDRSADSLNAITGEASISGRSEDGRYNNLPFDAKYKPKNGKFTSLEELRMIPYATDGFMQLFAKHFTVWGTKGKVSMCQIGQNLERSIVASLLGRLPRPADEENFRKYYEARMLLLAQPGIKMTAELWGTMLVQAGFQYDQKLFSDFTKKAADFECDPRDFKIVAVGTVDNVSSKITVVWHNNGAQGDIYYWREE